MIMPSFRTCLRSYVRQSCLPANDTVNETSDLRVSTVVRLIGGPLRAAILAEHLSGGHQHVCRMFENCLILLLFFGLSTAQ